MSETKNIIEGFVKNPLSLIILIWMFIIITFVLNYIGWLLIALIHPDITVQGITNFILSMLK